MTPNSDVHIREHGHLIADGRVLPSPPRVPPREVAKEPRQSAPLLLRYGQRRSSVSSVRTRTARLPR